MMKPPSSAMHLPALARPLGLLSPLFPQRQPILRLALTQLRASRKLNHIPHVLIAVVTLQKAPAPPTPTPAPPPPRVVWPWGPGQKLLSLGPSDTVTPFRGLLCPHRSFPFGGLPQRISVAEPGTAQNRTQMPCSAATPVFQVLEDTHVRVWGLPFSWQHWELKTAKRKRLANSCNFIFERLSVSLQSCSILRVPLANQSEEGGGRDCGGGRGRKCQKSTQYLGFIAQSEMRWYGQPSSTIFGTI